MSEKKEKQVLPRLKVWLLRGRSVTHNEAQKMWHTNRLASYIHRLRHGVHQMRICMTMIKTKEGEYGKYFLEVKPKKKQALKI